MPRPERVAIVLGTRPEIVKLAGVITGLGADAYVVHTGQHYDDSLSAQFFATYDLPQHEVKLENIGGRTRAAQFAGIIAQLDEHFTDQRPAAVVVQGDTNTAAAAAQTASFLGIPVVHVEAGLRSYDRAMPEEINRALVGVVADLHCAPTSVAAAQLRAEGVDPGRIVVTGNTVVEATLASLPSEAHRRVLLRETGLNAEGYVLATIHRPENTDDPIRLARILTVLADIAVPVVLPLHPRTLAAATRADLSHLLDRMRVVPALDHPRFLGLAAHARLLISDSGGIQEECTVLRRPLLVLRNSTERPEAIESGFARRVVPDEHLARHVDEALDDSKWSARLRGLVSPYGDGTASEQIVAHVRALVAAR